LPYEPMTPPTMKSQRAMSRAPQRRRGRRPHRSMKSRVGTVMTTLILPVSEFRDRDLHILNTRGNQVGVSGQSSHQENVCNVIHHNIHTALKLNYVPESLYQLLPHLSRASNKSPSPQVRTEQGEKGDLMRFLCNANSFLDLIHFSKDQCILQISFCIDVSNDRVRFLPASLRGQPSRRFGQDEEDKEEDDGRDHLQRPCCTEGRRAGDEAAAVRDIVHTIKLVKSRI